MAKLRRSDQRASAAAMARTASAARARAVMTTTSIVLARPWKPCRPSTIVRTAPSAASASSRQASTAPTVAAVQPATTAHDKASARPRIETSAPMPTRTTGPRTASLYRP